MNPKGNWTCKTMSRRFFLCFALRGTENCAWEITNKRKKGHPAARSCDKETCGGEAFLVLVFSCLQRRQRVPGSLCHLYMAACLIGAAAPQPRAAA